MKHILMVGDGNHYFNKTLVTKLLEDDVKCQFYFCSTAAISDSNIYYEIFDISIDIKNIPFYFNLPGLRSGYIARLMRKRLSKVVKSTNFDIIHFQSIMPWAAPLWKKGLFSDLKTVITVWGSDFYRSGRWQKKAMQVIADEADVVTIANNKMVDDFQALFGNRHKVKIVRFGLAALDEIRKLKATGAESTPLNRQKINLTIGYNRSKAQQHLAVIEELNRLPIEIKDQLNLIVPWTYGPTDPSYFQELKDQLSTSNMEHEVLTDFLSEKEMAELALRSDIMIQVQTTDAFSGTMQEFMYAENLVITGSWLPYDDFKNNNVFFLTIARLKELAPVLQNAISNLDSYSDTLTSGADGVYNLSSWSSNLPLWKSLYQ